MTKPRKPEIRPDSPQALADRANDGFLFVVRSTGRIAGSLSSGIVKRVSEVGQGLIGRKKNILKQQTTPLETAPPEQLDRQIKQAGPQYPPPDIEALLKQLSPRDTPGAIILREAVNDLLHGPEKARKRALKTVVGLGRVAEPLLLACLEQDSPEVAEIALEGLNQIDSQRLVGSISEMLGSSDTELRLVALHAAGRLPNDQQQPLLGRGLRDPSASVRRRAISSLARHDSYWAVAEAMRLCDDQEPDVQWAAVEALMAMRPSEAHTTLRLMMPSLDPVYRRRAAILLEQQKDQAALPEKTRQESNTTPKETKKKPIQKRLMDA